MTDLALRLPSTRVARRPGARTVLVWELEKLAAQFRTRLAFTVCLLGPFAFVAAVEASGTLPADTLFGRWAADSGFATPLVVLGFAAAFGFPALICLVAGDIFSAEDHLGTWKTVLTRSVGRGAVFTGKVLAAAVYSLAALAVLAASSLAAGVLVVGDGPLPGLSGNVVGAGDAVRLILLSWLLVVPPCLAFGAVGVLLSVLTRNSLVAILGSVALGLVMQFAGMVDGAPALRQALLGTHFLAWHGLFADPRFTGPVTLDLAVSAAYLVVCLSVAWLVFRRRDETGG